MFVEFFFIEISVIFLFMMILLDECSMLKLILSLFVYDFFCSWKFTKLICSRVGGEEKRKKEEGRRRKRRRGKKENKKRKKSPCAFGLFGLHGSIYTVFQFVRY